MLKREGRRNEWADLGDKSTKDQPTLATTTTKKQATLKFIYLFISWGGGNLFVVPLLHTPTG